MAVPSTAYTGDLLQEGTTDVDAITALFAVPDADDSVLKARFYLDGFISKAQGAAGGILTDFAFVGYCIVGSANYYMHNINRFHTSRLTIDGQECVIFNDGGLNTLGKVINVSISGNDVFNSAIAPFQSVASYYAEGNYSGWISTDNQATWKRILGNIYQNQNTISTSDSASFFEMTAGVPIYIRVVHDNDEGRYQVIIPYTPQIGLMIKPMLQNGLAGWPSQGATSNDDFYALSSDFRGAADGRLFYNNLSEPVANGWYVSGGWWYKVEGGSGFITQKGRAESGQWPAGDPANPPVPPSWVTFNYTAFTDIDHPSSCAITDPSEAGAIDRNNMPDDPNYNRYYLTTNHSIPASDGFYAYMLTGSRKNWMQLVNGWEVAGGSC